MSDLLTISAVAKHLSCSPRHVRRIIARGELPVIATGEGRKGDRIEPEALESFKRRKQRLLGKVTVCPSSSVKVFGSRASKSVNDELNDLLGKARPTKKRKKSKPPLENDSGTTNMRPS